MKKKQNQLNQEMTWLKQTCYQMWKSLCSGTDEEQIERFGDLVLATRNILKKAKPECKNELNLNL